MDLRLHGLDGLHIGVLSDDVFLALVEEHLVGLREEVLLAGNDDKHHQEDDQEDDEQHKGVALRGDGVRLRQILYREFVDGLRLRVHLVEV